MDIFWEIYAQRCISIPWMPHGDDLANILASNPKDPKSKIKDKLCYFLKLISLLLMIFLC